MNKYELVNDSTTLSVIVKLIRNGFMKPDVVRHMNIYDKFNSMEGSKMDRYTALGEEYKLNPKTVGKIINNLDKNAR